TLFAAQQPAFIVDAYTTRIVRRLGLVTEDGTRHAVRRLFTEALPHEAATMRAMFVASAAVRVSVVSIVAAMPRRSNDWRTASST
ncbi:MAG: hypothetical protein LC748_03790, partial [Thermomicrobia bacterium]|nr:hypothetical protein [Thermomicrobia bacterium]